MNNDEQIRIAHIIGKWVGGGVENVVMNYYKSINRSKIQFDFICDKDSTNIPYKEIEELGGKIILIPPYQKVFKYQKELRRILNEGQYKIVHSHINALSVFPLRAAKKANVPVRIAHSHSTTNKKEWKKNLLKILLKPFSKVYATDFFACTEHAAKWLFGKNENVYILNNAIEPEKFLFNEKIRKSKREELNIHNNTLIVGHCGRFVQQKNHKFILDIFYELHKKNCNSVLILIGQGPLEEEIKSKVKQLNIENNVIFLGQRNDINELYQIMDVFLFPSLYEGLGMVLIEAQASGCMCVASTEVPKTAGVTERCHFLDLSSSSNAWADFIIKNNEYNRKINYKDEISNSGFDINIECKKLEKKYNELGGIQND